MFSCQDGTLMYIMQKRNQCFLCGNGRMSYFDFLSSKNGKEMKRIKVMLPFQGFKKM